MKPSVLLIGSFLSLSGENPAVGEGLAPHLRRAGWQVLTTSNRQVRLARFFDMLSTVWLQRNEYGAAYVEVFSGPAFLWAEAVCQALQFVRKPYILALHGGGLPAFARRWPGRVRRLLRGANGVVAPSGFLAEGMQAYRKDIRLIPNPLNLEQYPFRLRSKPLPNLIWLRAFHDLYNPAMAIQALAELESQFPDISLAMIGPDKRDGSLQASHELVVRLGLGRHVQFVDGIPKREVPGWLEKADIFINTSNVDNTPVSVLEAMACGLCVVSTNVGGIPHLLEHEKDALLVSVGDSHVLAQAVTRLLTEPALAGCLSTAARIKAEQSDWSEVLPQWQQLFGKIMNEI